MQAISQATICSADNRDYKLRALFLNVVGDPAARVKPPTVDERQWQETLEAAGGEHNADNLWPVPAVGFRDLRIRQEAQRVAQQEDEERLRECRAVLLQGKQRRAAEILSRLEAAQRRHGEQLYRLLRVLRCLEGLEGALSVHGSSEVNEMAVRDLMARVTKVEHQLGPTSSTSLLSRSAAVASLASSRARAGAGASGAMKEAAKSIRPEVLDGTFTVLAEQLEAIRKLQAVVAKSERDLAIIGG